MELYNQEDIAVKELKNFSKIELSLGLDKKDAIPDAIKAEVIMVGSEVSNLNVGEIVYYDPAFTHSIKELGIIVLHHKGILIKE